MDAAVAATPNNNNNRPSAPVPPQQPPTTIHGFVQHYVNNESDLLKKWLRESKKFRANTKGWRKQSQVAYERTRNEYVGQLQKLASIQSREEDAYDTWTALTLMSSDSADDLRHVDDLDLVRESKRNKRKAERMAILQRRRRVLETALRIVDDQICEEHEMAPLLLPVIPPSSPQRTVTIPLVRSPPRTFVSIASPIAL